MRVHVVINPKAKNALMEWVHNFAEKIESEDVNFFTNTDNIKELSKIASIMKDIREDFILDDSKMIVPVMCDGELYLTEVPQHPMEIWDYLNNNPDGLSQKHWIYVRPFLKMLWNRMFDYKTEQCV